MRLTRLNGLPDLREVIPHSDNAPLARPVVRLGLQGEAGAQGPSLAATGDFSRPSAAARARPTQRHFASREGEREGRGVTRLVLVAVFSLAPRVPRLRKGRPRRVSGPASEARRSAGWFCAHLLFRAALRALPGRERLVHCAILVYLLEEPLPACGAERQRAERHKTPPRTRLGPNHLSFLSNFAPK